MDPTENPEFYCVKIESDWYLADTDSMFKKWWKDEATQFKSGHCDDYNNIEYLDTIRMVHYL